MENLKPLLELPVGGAGYIDSFTDKRAGSKLLAMGVLPGSKVEVLRAAPFGGALYVKVNQSYLALRTKEAASILLK
ncbi:MAG: FeoA family protein [Bacteroidota bacterium]